MASGEVSVVTGAGRGIGRAVALRLAGGGDMVVAVDIDESSALGTVHAIEAAGKRAVARVVDLADRRARDELIPWVLAEFGRVDVLVNNAAYTGSRHPFTDTDYAEWDRIFETNVGATAFLARAAATDMVRRGAGAIVNTSSIQQRMPVATYAAYVASKGAVVALTRALAVELSGSGVRVNAVEPGVIGTASFRDTLDAAGEDGDRSAALLARTGGPEEVAEAVAFLAGAAASFVTGVILPVDGGRHLSRRPDPFEQAFHDTPTPGKGSMSEACRATRQTAHAEPGEQRSEATP